MNKNIISLFTSHFTFGRSTLTTEKPELIIDKKNVLINSPDEIEQNRPISILSIARAYKLPEVYLVEDNFSGFIEAYNNFKDNNILLRFGLKLVICNDLEDKSEESFKSESKVIIWMKNSDSYKDLIKIYSKAATDGFYYIPRLDWKTLQKMWSDNLILSIPSYSSFLHNNLLKRHECIPDFGGIKPNIMYSKMELPFDNLIADSHINYGKQNKLDIIESHPVRFYSSKQLDSYICHRAINKRGAFSKPNLDNFASDKFSWESYLNK